MYERAMQCVRACVCICFVLRIYLCLCASKVICNYKLAISTTEKKHFTDSSPLAHSIVRFYGLLRCDCRTRCIHGCLLFSLFKLCDKNILITSSSFVWLHEQQWRKWRKKINENSDKKKRNTNWTEMTVWHRSAGNIYKIYRQLYTRLTTRTHTRIQLNNTMFK